MAHSTTRKAKPWPHKVALFSVTLCAGISWFHPKYPHFFLLLLPLPGAGPNFLTQPQPLYSLIPLGMVTNYSSSALQPLPPRLTVACTCGHLVTAHNFSPGLSSCLLTGFALCLLILLQSWPHACTRFSLAMSYPQSGMMLPCSQQYIMFLV